MHALLASTEIKANSHGIELRPSPRDLSGTGWFIQQELLPLSNVHYGMHARGRLK